MQTITINKPTNLTINSLNDHEDLKLFYLPVLPDNNQLIDALDKTLNELIAMDSVKSWNIQAHNISLSDELYITIYSIPLSGADEAIESNDKTFEDLFQILFSKLQQGLKPNEIPSHSIIIHDLETLQIYYNDHTINILWTMVIN